MPEKAIPLQIPKLGSEDSIVYDFSVPFSAHHSEPIIFRLWDEARREYGL